MTCCSISLFYFVGVGSLVVFLLLFFFLLVVFLALVVVHVSNDMVLLLSFVEFINIGVFDPFLLSLWGWFCIA